MKRFCICCSKLRAENSWVCDDCRDSIRVGIEVMTQANTGRAYHQCKKLCSRCARRAATILKPPPELLAELCERVNS